MFKTGGSEKWISKRTIFLIIPIIAVVYLVTFHPAEISSLISGTAHAVESSESLNEEKNTPSQEDPEAESKLEIMLTEETAKEWITAAKARQKELEKKEQELKLERLELETLRKDVQNQMTQLQDLRTQIQELLGQVDKETKKKIEKLVVMMQSTKPLQASQILAGLDTDLAANILLKMDPKKAGKIIDELQPAIMAEIIEQMDRYRKPS